MRDGCYYFLLFYSVFIYVYFKYQMAAQCLYTIHFLCSLTSGSCVPYNQDMLQLLSQREYLRGCSELGDEPCGLNPSCDVLHWDIVTFQIETGCSSVMYWRFVKLKRNTATVWRRYVCQKLINECYFNWTSPEFKLQKSFSALKCFWCTNLETLHW